MNEPVNQADDAPSMDATTAPAETMPAAGAIEIQRWQPTQFTIGIANHATGVSECIAVDTKALDSLIEFLQAVKWGALSAARVTVDKHGAAIDVARKT